MSSLARQVVYFGGVGLLSTLVHVMVAWLASRSVLANPFLANTAGFASAFGVSYLGHFYFTFALREGHQRTLRRFVLLSLAGFALSNVIVWTIVRGLNLPFGVAMGIVAVAVPGASFLASRYWAFSR